MTSRKGYTSLPDAELGAEQPGGDDRSTTSTSADPSSAEAKRDAGSAQDAKSDSAAKKEAAGAEKAGESPGKDAAADPTGV